MPTKAELKDQADRLGLDYAEDVTKAELETMLSFVDEEDVPEPEPEGSCFNCDKPAVWESDGATASVVRFCEDHAPR